MSEQIKPQDWRLANRLLSVDELAEYLGVPKSWVYGETRKTGPGSIPRVKLGKYLRFEPMKIRRWLQGRST